ncbi:MAG TPA: thioredoxin family protein [Flavobacteriaceae bacterium]|nr:thioredoxin family protein [Flavobacteriaceae bacterium]
MRITQIFAITAVFLCLIACDNTKQNKSGNKTSQEKQVGLDYTGELTEQDLINSAYTNNWYVPRKERYVTHQPSLKIIKEDINDFEIVVFMGTWCPDSHAEMPRFFKILDKADYNRDNLTVYTLDQDMSSTENVEKGKNITNVPTIIFYQDGKEVNRFVESPRESLARDMAKIVSGKTYKHIYE